MYLKVKNYQDGGLVYDTGERVMRDRGVVLFGMSPGNPYFKRHVIEKYVEFLGREHRKIVVIVPQEPSEHTYRAMSSKDAVGRAKKNAGRLRTHCKKAIEKVSSISNLPGDFHFVDWPREVGTHEVYLEKLDDMLRLYRTNALFRQDAAMMTARALGKNPRDETSDGESGRENFSLLRRRLRWKSFFFYFGLPVAYSGSDSIRKNS
ncbi:uncharacterized protein LOC116602083 [Nematostella vectensis]|uniref:uncharacterized protein LOC116602083 n=1 Tax=Nematostella vectensis TaxID=45351 RepID=UPI002076D751|nr:uncharacterized protein LOC116602083 [Nematostella vectensis]